MNGTGREAALAEAGPLSKHVYLRLVLGVECAIGLLSVGPNLCLIGVVWRAKVFPLNLRLLLINLKAVLVWFALGGALKSLYLLAFPLELRVITMRVCREIDLLLLNLSLLAVYFTIVALAMERACATIRYRTYDRSKAWFGAALLLGLWGLTLFLCLRDYFSTPPVVYRPICDLYLYVDTSSSNPILIAFVVLEIAAVLTIVCVWLHGRRMRAEVMTNRAMYDLSSRFLIDQNAQVNQLIMPSMGLHCCFYLPTYIYVLLIIPALPPTFSLGTKASLLQLNYLWRLIYALVHPILAATLNPHFRHQLAKTCLGVLLRRCGVSGCQVSSASNTERRHTEENVHFRFLEQMWRNPIRPITIKNRTVVS